MIVDLYMKKKIHYYKMNFKYIKYLNIKINE